MSRLELTPKFPQVATNQLATFSLYKIGDKSKQEVNSGTEKV